MRKKKVGIVATVVRVIISAAVYKTKIKKITQKKGENLMKRKTGRIVAIATVIVATVGAIVYKIRHFEK